ncbi:DNA phosphorothioation-associated putative methyltransferase [Nocardiopsis flavescens]|nr:DNA phosphorothioation-associated putative methyltransferase [Nocardiopsis flavescens]
MSHVAAGWVSNRRLTAIARRGLSVPARTALLDQQIGKTTTVLDYGCGRGDDLRSLADMGIQVEGWDPVYFPGGKQKVADVVLLTYVLNVIEDPCERRSTLNQAWDLADRVLVVSTRLDWERRRVTGEQFSDGLLTSRNTFQHLFGVNELRSYVQEVTQVRCVSAAPGVVYAFKYDNDRLAYLARRIIPDGSWQESTDATSAIAAVVAATEERGRALKVDEMPDQVVEFLGHFRQKEFNRLVRTAVDPEKMKKGAKRSTLDTLLFLALELFNGRGRFMDMPLFVQFDIRAFFSSYAEACKRADRLLLKLRDDSYIRAAMRGSCAGKMTPTSLYVHHRALAELPIVLRLYEHCAAIAAGRPAQWSVVRLQHEGRSVTWFDYPDFDSDPHPRLESSYSVDLATLKTSFTSYLECEDRPLLHRKQEFLSPEDPDVAKYRRLTKAETNAGLYENPGLIRTEQGWEAELRRCGRQLRGHRLIRRHEG